MGATPKNVKEKLIRKGVASRAQVWRMRCTIKVNIMESEIREAVGQGIIGALGAAWIWGCWYLSKKIAAKFADGPKKVNAAGCILTPIVFAASIFVLSFLGLAK
jgi:hypothetical protein